MVRMILRWVCLTGLILISFPYASMANDFGLTLDKMYDGLMTGVAKYDRPVILVTDFQNLNGEICDLGRYISRKLIQRFGENLSLTVIEKSQLYQFDPTVLNNPTAPDSIAAIKNEFKANLVVLGDVITVQSTVEINIKLYDLNEKTVVKAFSVESEKDAVLDELSDRNCQKPASDEITKTPESVTENELTPGEWRDKERRGVGFGFGLWSNTIFYDYNLNQALQVHVGYTYLSYIRYNDLGETVIETSGYCVTGELRYFLDSQKGWFIGGGSGVGRISQSYAYDDYFGIDADSSSAFIPVYAVGGWQGWDGYYFTVSLSIGTSVVLNESDKTGNIPVSDHATYAKQDFDMMKRPNNLGFLFGWHF